MEYDWRWWASRLCTLRIHRLSIHHPIPLKWCHYNPHTLHNTANFWQYHRFLQYKPQTFRYNPKTVTSTPHTLCYPSQFASHHNYRIPSRKTSLIDNHSKTGLLHHSEALVDVPINHLMKWRDWREYPPSYDNYSYGNYRPRLLRLLQCQDFELSLPHTYTSARQLQLNNPQLNSTLWSAHRSINPHGSHPYTATSVSPCRIARANSAISAT